VDLNVPIANFIEFNTIKDLRQYLKRVIYTPAVTGVNTPALVPLSTAKGFGAAILTGHLLGYPFSKSNTLTPDILQSIIKYKLGLDNKILRANKYLEEYGLDSFITITVLQVYKNDIGVNLPISFFIKYLTLALAREALNSILILPNPSRNALLVYPVTHST
jgi:acyl carrier protein